MGIQIVLISNELLRTTNVLTFMPDLFLLLRCEICKPHRRASTQPNTLGYRVKFLTDCQLFTNGHFNSPIFIRRCFIGLLVKNVRTHSILTTPSYLLHTF
ncbi:hypothetical protein D3C79_870030 [compost metagenome]